MPLPQAGDLWQFFRPEFYAPPDRQAELEATMDGHVIRHLGVLDRHLEGRDWLAGTTAYLDACRQRLLEIETTPRLFFHPADDYGPIA